MQGKHFRVICDSKIFYGRCIEGFETKSGVCGCCDVLNQRWAHIVQYMFILQFGDETLVKVFKTRCIETVCVYYLEHTVRRLADFKGYQEKTFPPKDQAMLGPRYSLGSLLYLLPLAYSSRCLQLQFTCRCGECSSHRGRVCPPKFFVRSALRAKESTSS